MAKRKQRKSTAPELPPTGKKVRVHRKTAQKLKGLTFLMALLFGLTLVFLFQSGDLKTPDVSFKLPKQAQLGTAVLLQDTYLRKNMLKESVAIADLSLGQEVQMLGRDESWVLVNVEGQKGYVPREMLLIE